MPGLLKGIMSNYIKTLEGGEAALVEFVYEYRRYFNLNFCTSAMDTTYVFNKTEYPVDPVDVVKSGIEMDFFWKHTNYKGIMHAFCVEKVRQHVEKGGAKRLTTTDTFEMSVNAKVVSLHFAIHYEGAARLAEIPMMAQYIARFEGANSPDFKHAYAFLKTNGALKEKHGDIYKRINAKLRRPLPRSGIVVAPTHAVYLHDNVIAAFVESFAPKE